MYFGRDVAYLCGGTSFKLAPAGAKISVSNVRGKNSVKHGTSKEPCSTCDGVIMLNNISVKQ